MKTGIKFVSVYYLLSVLFLYVSTFFFKTIRGEIISYLFWYYVMSYGIGLIIFPMTVSILQKYELSLKWKLGISFIVFIVLINCIPFFFDDGHLLTRDLVKAFFAEGHSLLTLNNLGIHLIAVVSFLASYFLFKKDAFWSGAVIQD